MAGDPSDLNRVLDRTSQQNGLSAQSCGRMRQYRAKAVTYKAVTHKAVTKMRETQNPTPERSTGPRTYSGDKARQGEIVLRKPWMRLVFIAGLVGCILLVLIIGIIAGR